MDPHDEEQRSEEGDVHGQQPDARRGQQAEGGEGREHQREEGWVDVGDHPRLGPPGVLEVGVDVRAVRGGLGAAEIVDEIEAQALRRQGQPLDDRPREVIGADAEHEHEQHPIAKRCLVQAPDAVPAFHAARACAIASGLRLAPPGDDAKSGRDRAGAGRVKRWYGVRRLYEASFRDRVLLVLVLSIGAYYLTWSVVQWLTLTPESLRFDFVNYFGGAQAAAHGTDIYADFKHSWGTQAWVVAYIYPPFFALVLAPLTAFGLLAAARIWLLAVHVAFFGSLLLIVRIHPELTRSGRRLLWLASLGFMPVYLNLKFQQVATVWLLLITATLW